MKYLIIIVRIGLAGVLGIAVVVYCFLGYFVTSTQNHIITDGLGRVLERMPAWANYLPFGNGPLWPGLGWAALDFVLFWLFMGLTAILVGIKAND